MNVRLRPFTLLASLTLVACAPTDPASETEAATGGGASAQPTGDGGNGSFQDAEQCNGFDDDADGEVDEGCPCEDGESQACFPGSPAQANVGACRSGTQHCAASGSGEFQTGAWGACEGSVGPREEVCGNGVDEDCDGADASCGAGGSGAGGGGAGGSDGAGGGAGCTPSAEVCGNGVDEDCDGADTPCADTVDVDLFLIGDCITATCPGDHPFPVGCDVLFSPGDDRGCVANQPSSSVVYFQAGDQCDQGLVGGTLTCSTVMGSGLDASNCPINKPIPIYAPTPSGCPAVQ